MVPTAPQIHPVEGPINAPTAPPLRLLFWESTAGCNLACVHCRRLDVSRQLMRDDLTTDDALTLIRSLPQTGRPILVFSGGEPLMRPDIFDLASEATHVGLPIALATNGTIIGPDRTKGTLASEVSHTYVRNSGDDGLAMWSENHADHDNTFAANTVVLPMLANGIAVYGGRDNAVTGNYVADVVTDGGGLHVANRFAAVPLTVPPRWPATRSCAPAGYGSTPPTVR